MDRDDMERLEGTVNTVTFRNEVSGWTVLELEAYEELVTVVGVLPEVYAGEEVKLLGHWGTHPNFGAQFKAEYMERSQPVSETAILRYLSSGAVKGIGPSTASRLVMKFGDKTLQILENEPERLSEIKGISLAKAKAIGEDYSQKFGIREAMVSLSQYGLTPNETMNAWKKWGSSTVDKVRESPYNLCVEGIGISFDRADEIARSMERPADDETRIKAGILYVLRHNFGNGHTCLPLQKVAEVTAGRLGVEEELCFAALSGMIEGMELKEEEFPNGSFVFLPNAHRAESYAAGRIKLMLQFTPPPCSDVNEGISMIEQQMGITFDPLQRSAIDQALNKGLLILTGGPGTGKTTTLNGIIRLLEENGEKVVIAAPTGRAAKRISEVTGKEAKTLHRLLEVEWDQNDRPVFSRNERNPLDCDAVVVDELSMVDALLFESLLRALRLGCRLILVGDNDQLPPVGAGNVLGDLIDSKLLPVVALTEVFRQASESTIITNAHKIVRGELPELTKKDSDFFFLPAQTPERVVQTVCDLCSARLPVAYGYSPFAQIQVLCPGRKGETGTVQLNLRLQEALNPPDAGKREIKVGAILFRQGDKVMQIKNNYSIPWTRDDGTEGEGVFNGDIGVLEEVDRASASMTIRFEDRVALYTAEAAVDLELAYATTVHKSQGSEFEAVILPLFSVPPLLSYRNLLYTAVTRAKTLLILVGQAQVVADMVHNNRKTKRYSGLKTFLCQREEEA